MSTCGGVQFRGEDCWPRPAEHQLIIKTRIWKQACADNVSRVIVRSYSWLPPRQRSASFESVEDRSCPRHMRTALRGLRGLQRAVLVHWCRFVVPWLSIFGWYRLPLVLQYQRRPQASLRITCAHIASHWPAHTHVVNAERFAQWLNHVVLIEADRS